MESKICNKCGEDLVIDKFRECFYKNGNSYRKSVCKTCERDYTKQWIKDNPGYTKEYYERNKLVIKERSRQWRKDNIERAREIDSQYYGRHKKEKAERDRRYLENNREKVYAKNERWRKANLDKKNAVSVRRRARKLKQLPPTADKDKMNYMYCIANRMTEESGVEYQVDHIKPISKGGLHHEHNLQILRKDLNLKKSNKWPLTKKEKDMYMGITLNGLEESGGNK